MNVTNCITRLLKISLHKVCHFIEGFCYCSKLSPKSAINFGDLWLGSSLHDMSRLLCSLWNDDAIEFHQTGHSDTFPSGLVGGGRVVIDNLHVAPGFAIGCGISFASPRSGLGRGLQLLLDGDLLHLMVTCKEYK